jgi:uncharacterized protein YbjT (DUF2867 family)
VWWNGHDFVITILGLGFTGKRLAWRLLRRGVPVFSAVRGVERFGDLANAGLRLSELSLAEPGSALLPRNAVVVDSIPPLPGEENTRLRGLIEKMKPRRVIYISSTGVYGDRIEVDADTEAQPNDERGRLRLDEERWISSAEWTHLILRSAAIYGPGRGVHAAVRSGKMPRGVNAGIVSRIHVEDLARIIEAGIFSDLEGAWPVADAAPCSTMEICEWCATLFKRESMNFVAGTDQIAGRRVDGRKIRELLGIDLMHPSWKAGILASLAEERGD